MDPSALENVSRSLESSLDFWGAMLLVATLVVVIGLVLEYWHEVKEFWVHVSWPMATFPWGKLIALSGGILVTIGVFGELFVTYKASRIETKLRENNHKIETMLAGEASDAWQKSGTAIERAGKLEKEAAALRLENTRLEAIIQPRSLSSDQQRQIIEVLRKFSGHPAVEISSYGLDAEALPLGTQLISIFRSATGTIPIEERILL